jgi:hypothetical protein
MQTTADAERMDRDRVNEQRWRQAATESVRRRCDVTAFDKPQTGPDRIQPYDHWGTITVAGAWLAFYVITAIHHFISSGN